MFWTNYERFCKSVGKSANAVAADIGIKSTGTVTGWKNGATPRRNVLLKLSKYFGCSIDDLIDGEETTRQHEADGLSDEQQELIRLIPTMTAAEVSVLLATARGQVAARTIPGAPSQSE